jgi:hypothetical protein
MTMKYVFYSTVVLFVLAIWLLFGTMRSQQNAQARYQATVKYLAEFNYKFIAIDNQIDWDTYIDQLEKVSSSNSLFYDQLYRHECQVVDGKRMAGK